MARDASKIAVQTPKKSQPIGRRRPCGGISQQRSALSIQALCERCRKLQKLQTHAAARLHGLRARRGPLLPPRRLEVTLDLRGVVRALAQRASSLVGCVETVWRCWGRRRRRSHLQRAREEAEDLGQRPAVLRALGHLVGPPGGPPSVSPRDGAASGSQWRCRTAVPPRPRLDVASKSGPDNPKRIVLEATSRGVAAPGTPCSAGSTSRSRRRAAPRVALSFQT